MSRPLRIAVENGWYHVLNRGINGRQLFPDDHAKRAFHLNPVRIKRLGGHEARAGAEQRLGRVAEEVDRAESNILL